MAEAFTDIGTPYRALIPSQRGAREAFAKINALLTGEEEIARERDRRAAMASTAAPSAPAALDGRPLMETLVARLEPGPRPRRIAWPTTERVCDDALAAARGRPWLDLPPRRRRRRAGRRAGARSEAEGAALVVKANGDSPLLAAEVIDSAIDQIVLQDADCVTGKNGYTGLPVGLGAEVLTAAALARLDREVTAPEQRESITAAVFDKSFDYAWAPAITPLEWRAPELDLCVDTPEDLAPGGHPALLPPRPGLRLAGAADWPRPRRPPPARRQPKGRPAHEPTHDSAKPITIGKRRVGAGEPVFVIAEIGMNHNGDLDLARRMIEAAGACGVDAVKFQSFRTDAFLSTDPGPGRAAALRDPGGLVSGAEWLREAAGVEFFSTPLDAGSAESWRPSACPVSRSPPATSPTCR